MCSAKIEFRRSIMNCVVFFLSTILILPLGCWTGDLYPSYNITVDPIKVAEWANDRAVEYVTTVRLFDYDHHIFQYRRYPCQYFYTDEIQIYNDQETVRQCYHNETTADYEYRFRLHLDSRHVEPFILRNIAIQCNYVNCSFTRLSMKFLQIGWNLNGRSANPDCSFDINQPYAILDSPYTLSEVITLRCKTLEACNHSKTNLETAFTSQVAFVYGSSYELEVPYCSLEKKLSYALEPSLSETNRLLKQLIEIVERNFNHLEQHHEHEKDE